MEIPTGSPKLPPMSPRHIQEAARISRNIPETLKQGSPYPRKYALRLGRNPTYRPYRHIGSGRRESLCQDEPKTHSLPQAPKTPQEVSRTLPRFCQCRTPWVCLKTFNGQTQGVRLGESRYNIRYMMHTIYHRLYNTNCARRRCIMYSICYMIYAIDCIGSSIYHTLYTT